MRTLLPTDGSGSIVSYDHHKYLYIRKEYLYMKKRIMSLTLTALMVLSLLSTPALAAEVSTSADNELAITAQMGVQPLADTVPSEYRNLSSESYTAKLIDLAATKASLTKYYFSTGTGEINMDFSLERSGTTTQTKRVLKVYLYEKTSTGSWTKTSKEATVTFYGTSVSTSKSFTGLDANKFYYLSFKNESASSTGSRCDISGSIVVSE